MSKSAFWDTNLLIYWIEQKEAFEAHIGALVTWLGDENISSVTSALSLAEILVQPMSLKKTGLAKQYKDILSEFGCLSFGVEQAWAFAEIRAKYPTIKPPDCIQLACASVHGVDYFLTNDQALTSIAVPGIGKIQDLSSVASLAR